MKLMHTKTPDFVQKMHNAASKGNKTLVMKGMETVRSGKWASIKTGQIEEITGKTALEEGVSSLEMVILNENPGGNEDCPAQGARQGRQRRQIVRFPRSLRV